MKTRTKAQPSRSCRAATRMRRIGWIPVKGYELATSIWTGKEAEEEQARAWGTEFSGVALHVPSGRPISRATTNTNPAEGSRQ